MTFGVVKVIVILKMAPLYFPNFNLQKSPHVHITTLLLCAYTAMKKKQLCISPVFPDSNDAEHLLNPPPPYGENIELRALSQFLLLGGCLLNIF